MPPVDRRSWLPAWRRFLLRAQAQDAALPPPPPSAATWIDALASEGLVAAAAAHAARPTLPAPLREALATREAEQTAWRLLALATLRRVLTALDAAGIRPLVLKGLPLAQRLSGDAHARDAGDLDLLVLPTELAHAAATLEGLGLAPQQLLVPTSRLAQGLGPGALTFRGSGGVDVDLHWSLGEIGVGVALDLAQVATRAHTITVEGLAVRTLCDEDLLVYLAAHGGRHGWSRAGWIRDVVGLLRVAPALDGEAVTALATRAGLRRHVGVALALVEREGGLALPPWAAMLARTPAARGLLERWDNVRSALDEDPRREPSLVRVWRRGARERLRDRVRDRLLWTVDAVRWRGASPVSLGWALLKSPMRLATLLARRVGAPRGGQAPEDAVPP